MKESRRIMPLRMELFKCVRCGRWFVEWKCPVCRHLYGRHTTRHIIDAECHNCHRDRLHDFTRPDLNVDKHRHYMALHLTPRQRIKQYLS